MQRHTRFSQFFGFQFEMRRVVPGRARLPDPRAMGLEEDLRSHNLGILSLLPKVTIISRLCRISAANVNSYVLGRIIVARRQYFSGLDPALSPSVIGLAARGSEAVYGRDSPPPAFAPWN
jgi:hypothetical protein